MKKIYFVFLAFGLLITHVPAVIIEAESADSTSVEASKSFSEMYTDKYVSDVEQITSNIVQQDGVYIIDYSKLDNIDSNTLIKAEGMIYYLNNPEEVDYTGIVINQTTGPALTPRGFGNWYWWGYAYTYTRRDLQRAANNAQNIGTVAALAMFIPDVSWSKAVGAAGVVISAVGGIINLVNARYLTINFVSGVVTFNIEW